MSWTICFILSAATLIASALYAVYYRVSKRKMRLSAFKAFFIGTFISVYIAMLPIFAETLKDNPPTLFKVFLFSILQTIQVFTINVEAGFITESINSSAGGIASAYSVLMSALFIIAPFLTFGIIVSLFKNTVAKLVYLLNRCKDTYIFNTLDERALTLAESIRKNHKGAMIVFASADHDDETLSKRAEKIKELRALVIDAEISSDFFAFHSRSAAMNFFALDGDEKTNINETLAVCKKYAKRDNTGMYVLASSKESELMLSNSYGGKVRLRRMDEARSFTYGMLFEKGKTLFETAKVSSGDEVEDKITAVIIGLGAYGTEMLKALTWFCQMDGYNVEIHAIDPDEKAEEKFAAQCPELMSAKYNGVFVPNESRYKIVIHSGICADTKSFCDVVSEIPDITFAFVCLGSDGDNLRSAAEVRMLCERTHCSPAIFAVISDPLVSVAVPGITNHRGEEYRIEAVGNIDSLWSEDVLLGTELEKLALERHLKWGSEEDFWRFEYNYRSSMASAIHMRARMICGVPGADKKEEELTDEERDRIERLEHRRWSAYMRSEGFIYAGTPDKSGRNDLAKMHHNLVIFDKLSEEDKRKDSSIGTK